MNTVRPGETRVDRGFQQPFTKKPNLCEPKVVATCFSQLKPSSVAGEAACPLQPEGNMAVPSQQLA